MNNQIWKPSNYGRPRVNLHFTGYLQYDKPGLDHYIFLFYDMRAWRHL